MLQRRKTRWSRRTKCWLHFLNFISEVSRAENSFNKCDILSYLLPTQNTRKYCSIIFESSFFDSNPIIQELTPISMYLWYPFFCDHILNKSHRSHYGGLDQYHAMNFPFCCSQANELLPELICCCLLRKPGVWSHKQVLAPLKPARTSVLCQSCKLLRVAVLRSYKLLRREVWHRYKMVQHKWCRCNCSFLRFGQTFLY